MSDVTIFAPSPILTVTVEDHPDGSEIHVHAGGRGVWQAQMLLGLGVSVHMCCVLTAGVAAAMARGEQVRDAATLGAAAGTLNVTRHGLGTGDASTVDRLRESIEVRELTDEQSAEVEQPVTGRVSLDGLAALAEPEEES